jgi:hypothetical protein
MKEKKFSLDKRGTRKKTIKTDRVSRVRRAVKNLGESKFGNDPALKKRIVIKEDGRYLIYYDFIK